MNQIIHTDKAPAAIGPYSQAVQAGNMLFVSGQIPLDPATGAVVEGDVTVQAKQVFENVKAILTEAGATFEDEDAVTPSDWMTKQRLYADGLVGQDNSADRRKALLRMWGYPEKISANRLIDLINAAKTEQEYKNALQKIEKREKIG